MTILPLIFENGHVFVKLNEDLWLFDTGAPTSFGDTQEITLEEETFHIDKSYMGLDAENLSGFVDCQCTGILGADVLCQFDHILDIHKKTITISEAELEHAGQSVQLSEFMNIPILTVHIDGSDYRMFFDTGAQISYFQDPSLTDFPKVGSVTDFYPGVGQFQTDTHRVEAEISGVAFSIPCGTLPGLLGATLMMASTQGIIGNQILQDRVVGFFPRRGVLCL